MGASGGEVLASQSSSPTRADYLLRLCIGRPYRTTVPIVALPGARVSIAKARHPQARSARSPPRDRYASHLSFAARSQVAKPKSGLRLIRADSEQSRMPPE